jgi:hypothetical protein
MKAKLVSRSLERMTAPLQRSAVQRSTAGRQQVPRAPDARAIQWLSDGIAGEKSGDPKRVDAGYGDLVAIAAMPRVQRRGPGPALDGDRADASKPALGDDRPPPSPETPAERNEPFGSRADAPGAIAKTGIASTGTPFAHLPAIQHSFGHHDVSGIRAHIGADADSAAARLGARAYTFGDHAAFAGGPPDLHTAAHEAAHAVQQRVGIGRAGGIDGGANDPLERHANTVADAVVRGVPAEPLLDQLIGHGSSTTPTATVQRQPAPNQDPAAGVSIGEDFLQKLTPAELVEQAALLISTLENGNPSASDRQGLEQNLAMLEEHATAQSIQVPVAGAFRVRQVIRGLAPDIAALVQQLGEIARSDVDFGDSTMPLRLSGFYAEAEWDADQLGWIVDAMSEALQRAASAEAGGPQSEQLLRDAGTRVTASVFGAQAVAVHIAYLKVALWVGALAPRQAGSDRREHSEGEGLPGRERQDASVGRSKRTAASHRERERGRGRAAASRGQSALGQQAQAPGDRQGRGAGRSAVEGREGNAGAHQARARGMEAGARLRGAHQRYQPWQGAAAGRGERRRRLGAHEWRAGIHLRHA